MRTIAIDALGIGQPGGGRSATLTLLEELLRQDTTSRYLLMLDQAEPALALGPHVVQHIIPIKHRLVSRLWAQLTWPRLFRQEHVDLVHHIKNLAVSGLRAKSVVTIYDLTILLHPDIYTLLDRVYWRYVQPRHLRRADRIIAISQTTAADLQRFYDLDEEKIEVIYPAYNPRFRPQPLEDCARVRKQYDTGPRYILHVGSLSRKKNLLPLLQAFEQVRSQLPEVRLVLVGRSYGKGHDTAFFAHLDASPHRDAVILTGPVPDDDLPPLYAGAELMVFPSLHEGFGIVPLEAMACGTPVIISSGGALPEVVGKGGIMLDDASQVDPLSEAMLRLLQDEALRQAWAERGLIWSRRYSAQEAARQTLALYDEMLARAQGACDHA